MTNSVDTDFARSIRKAGRAFMKTKSKDPSVEGLSLAKYLLSDKPLGTGERKMLAELVIGDWRLGQRRPLVTPIHPIVIAVVAKLRKLVGEGWKKEAAKVEVASTFGINRSTVENYEAMTVEREEAIKVPKRQFPLD